LANRKDVYEEIEKEINLYPRYLRNYYFSSKTERERKIKEFYSAIPLNSVVLEGACGKLSRIREFNADTSNIKKLIGVDLLEESIKLNEDLDYKIVSDLENLSVKKNYFNVVHLSNVVEHLNNPERVFNEASQVLKKGGILIISTKNIYSPFMFINIFLPFNLRFWVKNKILRSPGHHLDTFDAPYKCNSTKKIRCALNNLGFKEEQIWLWGWPLIITPSIGLFFSMIYEKLTDMKLFRFTKPNIYAKFRKI
jgi:SAM-dependent methyltransferase